MQPFTSLHRFISRAFHSSLVLSADPSIPPPASRDFHQFLESFADSSGPQLRRPSATLMAMMTTATTMMKTVALVA
ncbi:hypothetical protein M6B38_326050 [Iris pallida]|uniref:Uncharacterized protein n=1 Tax=Iris pallida TaxID=29817 RepID=A0AAX6H6T9_IRIPA|nr:hypothetical protein M6B38_326045 [Iris pallida]KAJ6836544.1 hypothetical protein M6B38_326050 [Iris pallida]